MEKKPAVLITHDSEEAKLRRALERTPTERFRFLMKLIRIDRSLQSAVVTHFQDKEHGSAG